MAGCASISVLYGGRKIRITGRSIVKFGVSLAALLLALAVPASAQDTGGASYEAAPEPSPAAAPKKPAAKPAAKPAPATTASTTAKPAGEPAESLTAGRNLDAEFGWTIVGDPATGARLGLPGKMVPVTRDLPHGTRWSSRHGDIQVETFRLVTNEAIAALFERYKREPASRKPEYSLMKPDNFFISGLQGLKKFSLKAQLKDGELRGFVAMYDQAIEGIMAPAAIAMTTAYTPFPDAPAPYAALSKRVEYGTALVVSPRGHIVADRNVTDNCQVIVASGIGNAERIASDPDSGLALLRVYGASNLASAPLAADAPATADLTLVGIADPNTQDGDRKRSEVKAKLTDGRAIELRQSVPVAGFSGAAALDGQGRVLGTMQMRSAVVASADQPAAPPVRLVTAATIRKFLDANGVAAQAGGDPKASVIRVICVRK